MLYDGTSALHLVKIQDNNLNTQESITFSSGMLWVALLSSGEGSFSANPPQSAQAGMLAIGRSALDFTALEACHILSAQFEGRIASDFSSGLPVDLYIAKGESCPHAAQLLSELLHTRDVLTQSKIAFALFCELGNADAAAPALPELVSLAIEDIHANYAQLYGVEELSERLGVSKSHLVRAFHSAVGISPGKYLTNVRINAAKQLLLHREYSLDVIASLCGFSGANYLCRVFKKEVGISPAVWRAGAVTHNTAFPTSQAERSLYI